MTEGERPRTPPVSPRQLASLLAAGTAAAIVGLILPAGPATQAWFLAFVTGAGLAVGSLSILMLGHLFGEDWLDPVRAEVESAARTVPLLILFALPLALRLPELYPWAAGVAPDAAERGLLSPAPFLLRSGLYLAAWSALAFWLTTTGKPWRASAIGIAILAITANAAASDWLVTREPGWRSGLFPFGWTLQQCLAALAGAVTLSLARGESPAAHRMGSLERTLVVLVGLVGWTWFAQFLIVWLADLPGEAAWYARREGFWLWPLRAAAAAGAGTLLLLVPAGTGRRAVLAGAVGALAGHAVLALWTVRPADGAPGPTPWDLAVPAALATLWAAWFTAAYRRRPTYGTERGVER